ncbi:hypothetical protein Tco_0016789 [Tanacetum coccineum]
MLLVSWFNEVTAATRNVSTASILLVLPLRFLVLLVSRLDLLGDAIVLFIFLIVRNGGQFEYWKAGLVVVLIVCGGMFKEIISQGEALKIVSLMEIKGAENVVADHLSRLENPNMDELRDEDIDDIFPDETLRNVSSNDEE